MADICHDCENPAWTGKTIEAPAMPSGGEGGTSNFNALENRPKYDGVRMTGNTDIPNTARDVERLDGDITDIQGLIPETATTENQLADKDFVNSSVATNTANFVGTFNSLEELEAVENPSNNDYGFVVSTDEQGNTVFNRYKYVSSVESWEFEYALNNSSFTAAQWAAINSGVTEGNVEKINAILEITSTGNGLILENNGQLRQKLYTETGANTDASMDQKSTTEAINAIWGQARVLTAEDYNYPADNPTKVALWLLEPGIYRWAGVFGRNVLMTSNGSLQSMYDYYSCMAIVTNNPHNGDIFKTILSIGSAGNGILISGGIFNPGLVMATVKISDGTASGDGAPRSCSQRVRANLTEVNYGHVLDATQGKVLKDMIGTLSNLKTTTKTNTVAAINEVLGYKGQARVLTSADYNWPTSGTKTGVALWLLEPGVYALSDSSVNIYTQSGQVTTASDGYVVVGGESSGYVPILLRTNNLKVGSIQKSTGSGTYYSILDQSSIINNLTNTSTTNPLSAKQGKVLKDLVDGKQDVLTEGNGIEIDNENVISIATISTEDWSALWQ